VTRRGYSEDADDNVVLTMTRKDCERLLLTLGYALGACEREHGEHDRGDFLNYVNRLFAGSPHFQPYDVAAQPSSKNSN